MHEALYYQQREVEVRCELCPHFCRLRNGEKGLCGVRQEAGGKLFSLNYGVCAGMALDPIEKKPLYHFQPGRLVFSIGTLGCNLGCGFCQNWHLARQAPGVQTVSLTPAQLLSRMQSAQQKPLGIAYTYSEPGMWFEYVLATAKLVREQGYKNIMVTNGFLNPEPLRQLLPLIDAFNIDVKSFQEEYYQKHCAGRLEPVLRYVEMASASAHVELTYLVVPGLNDKDDEILRFTTWVAEINPAIPVHFSRYYPQHKFDLPPTPVQVMEHIRDLATEKLQYVYLGNLPGHVGANTNCPACGETTIFRSGYRTQNRLQNGSCPDCGGQIGMG